MINVDLVQVLYKKKIFMIVGIWIPIEMKVIFYNDSLSSFHSTAFVFLTFIF